MSGIHSVLRRMPRTTLMQYPPRNGANFHFSRSFRLTTQKPVIQSYVRFAGTSTISRSSLARTRTPLTSTSIPRRNGEKNMKQVEWTRVGWSVLAIAGSAYILNQALNGPSNVITKESEASANVLLMENKMLSDQYVRKFVNETFGYVAGGLALTATSALALHRFGWSVRLMSMNPWAVMGSGLVATLASLTAVYSVHPSDVGLKHASWAAFNVANAAVLSPLYFSAPGLLARAGLLTTGVVGSLSYTAMTAKQDQFLWLGGPIFAGVCVVALTSLGGMILPVTSAALPLLQSVSLYGGLAVFGGAVLYDTQNVVRVAKMSEAGQKVRDPIVASIGVYLDTLNIFVRIVSLLEQGSSRRKK